MYKYLKIRISECEVMQNLYIKLIIMFAFTKIEVFTLAQLAEIRMTSLARILCVIMMVMPFLQFNLTPL